MFVQLSSDECQYLLNLIFEMDFDTKFTERQRGYTIPKIQRIQKDPRSARLAYQDVDYLLELISDDDLEEVEQIRGMTEQTLLQIQQLQAQKLEENRDVETQRELRKARRRGLGVAESNEPLLQEKFQHTSA